MLDNWWHIQQCDARDPLHCYKNIDLLLTDTPAIETLAHEQIEYALNQWAKRMSDLGTMIVCTTLPLTNLEFGNFLNYSHEEYASNPGRKVWTDKKIEEHTKVNDLVCDPFCGTSTTGECAIRLGRNYIGTDIAKGPIETSYEQLVSMYAL